MNAIRKRDFIAGIGIILATWPPALAADNSTPVVGFLSSGAQGSDATRLAALWRGLNEAGYVEGRNVTSISRCERPERSAVRIGHRVDRQVAVIVALGGPSVAAAAKRGTQMVPV